MCFITAGMGGGTGTGAAPIIAQAARELGVLTVGVVTKPFQFEGAKRMRQAEDGVDALQRVVDTLIIIPNQNLFRLANEKTTFTEAFALADDVLYQGVKGVTDLMVRPGMINLDFADVRSVMDEMGKAMMGTGEATGEDRAIQAAEKAIANPLLDEISLRGARGVLINITGGPDLTLFELDEAANRIREEVDPEANIIVGSTLDDDMIGAIRVSVVATGIDAADTRQELPVPRRSMAQPLKQSVAVGMSHGDSRAAAPAPQMMPTLQVTSVTAAPAPQQTEPSLFDQGLDVRRAAAQDQAEDIFDDYEDEAVDDLPPPAYKPAMPQFQPRNDMTDSAEDFVAPRAPAPGTPSAEAMARLSAAVQRTAPTAAAPRPAPQPAEAPVGRFGINSLINRMTGHSAEAPALPPRVQPPAQPAMRTQAAQAPQPQSAPRPRADGGPEQDKIEIPAFLRRQAN
jgi:cell division protein FtsZ